MTTSAPIPSRLIELVEALEEELSERTVGFRIDDDDLEDLKTVRDAVDYVMAKIGRGLTAGAKSHPSNGEYIHGAYDPALEPSAAEELSSPAED